MDPSSEFSRRIAPFFSEGDQLVRAWITDKNGVPEAIIENPSDYNKGGVANLLEYLKDLANCLLVQFDPDLNSDTWMDFIFHQHFGLPRWPGETNQEWAQRVSDFVLAPKLSPASIIFFTRPYSATEPEILEGLESAAFAGRCYAGVGRTGIIQTPGYKYGTWMFPARARSTSSAVYTLTIRLTDTANADLEKLAEIMRRWVHPGIRWKVLIDQT